MTSFLSINKSKHVEKMAGDVLASPPDPGGEARDVFELF